MKRARLTILALLAFLAASSSWSEVTADGGLTVKNTTGVASAGTVGLEQADRATAWLKLTGPATEFLLRGSFSFTYANGKPTSLIDVERLSLTSSVAGDGKPLSRLESALGRRSVTDHTGFVVAQTLDGFDLTASYPVASVTASVGTTFLPNKATAPLVLSLADVADLSNSQVLMGSPRVVGLVEIVFPSVLKQRITISLAMQEDLRGLLHNPATGTVFGKRAGIVAQGTTAFDPSKGGLLDTQYEGLGIRGNIVGGLFYNAFFTLNTGRTLSYVSGSYTYEPILAGVGGLGLNLYAEKVLGSVAGMRFVYSTGDTWASRSSAIEGSLTATPSLYVPVTARPLSLVFAPTLGNIAFAEASYSVRPFAGLGASALANLQVGLTALVFIRPVAGPISVTIPNAASTDAYLGSEADLSLVFRPFSDLALEAAGGIFLPNAAATGPFPGATPRWRANVTASFSL